MNYLYNGEPVIFVKRFWQHPDSGVAYPFGWDLSGLEGITVAPDTPPYTPTLNDLKDAKKAEITAACESQILAGFESDALGETHHYPAEDRDQVNLSGSILRAGLPGTLETDPFPFLCADGDGVWEFRVHSASEIQQVGRDAYDAILQARIKHATLQAQVASAVDAEGLEAISW